jgi:hypothetical protein
MELKTCTSCNTIFPATVEFFYQQKKGNSIFFRAVCKTCHNKKRQAKKYSEKILALKAQLKEELAKEAAAKEAAKMICSYCEKEADSLNDKNFCAACEEEERLYYLEVEKELQEAAAQKAEETKEFDEWYEGLKGHIFHCKTCEKEKSIDEMKVVKTRKYVTKYCRRCNNEKNKEYKEMHKANVYVKVLEKRREKQNAENND